MLMIKKKLQTILQRRVRSAFSLLEIMVILFIISLGLVGVLSLIIQNIQSQSYNKNNFIAYQLAQEGVELIRQVRDSNWKNGVNFGTNLVPLSSFVGEYYMDYQDTIPHDASSNPTLLTVLKQDSYGFYFHDATSPAANTPFSRLIRITDLSENDFRVNSIVTWQDHNRDYSYDLETFLYDWRYITNK